MLKRLNILEFALPHLFNRPTNPLQSRYVLPVAMPITLDFGRPKIQVRFGELTDLTAMAVPETSMNEDRLSATDENYVGLSGKILPMQPVAIAQSVQKRANNQLGLGMLRAYPRHQSAAAGLSPVIHHPEVV